MTAPAFDHSFARLNDAFFERVRPAAAPKPRLIRLNLDVAAQLGLDSDWLSSAPGLAMLSGNRLPESADPIAMVYAGHQFGGFSPRLGDGRALLLGELVGPDGTRRDLQLKGSGQTPFSRRGDGKSPLGPVLREYIVSEAMAALNVPTTRALAAIETGEVVQRDTPLPGAILVRVASSHIRVGTFEYFRSQGDIERLQQLVDYVIDRHYPEALREENPYRAFLEGVARRQADLISQWMQLGFVHGVMNTDNMQIAGETIDFGPCAFMEAFDAETVFSSIDHQGRYAWCNQPGIGQWNLTRLAETLIPLLSNQEGEAIEQAKLALERFGAEFNLRYIGGFCEKLGLHAPPHDPESTQAFLNRTFSVLSSESVDFTLFFRHLTRIAKGGGSRAFLSLFDHQEAAEDWLRDWKDLFEGDAGDHESTSKRVDRMHEVNPIFIPRNHRVEQAIQSGMRGDFSDFERLTAVLTRPFDEQPEHLELELPANDSERVDQTFCGT